MRFTNRYFLSVFFVFLLAPACKPSEKANVDAPKSEIEHQWGTEKERAHKAEVQVAQLTAKNRELRERAAPAACTLEAAKIYNKDSFEAAEVQWQADEQKRERVLRMIKDVKRRDLTAPRLPVRPPVITGTYPEYRGQMLPRITLEKGCVAYYQISKDPVAMHEVTASSWEEVLLLAGANLGNLMEEGGERNENDRNAKQAEFLKHPLPSWVNAEADESAREAIVTVLRSEQLTLELVRYVLDDFLRAYPLSEVNKIHHAWIADLFGASKADMQKLAQKAEADAEYLKRPEVELPGFFFDRWSERGGGPGGDQLVLTFQWALARIAREFVHPQANRMAEFVASRLQTSQMDAESVALLSNALSK